MNNISRYNIAAVIFDSYGRVLLCKRSMEKKIAPGKWRMPGGGIEKGETSFQAIKRELLEELSVAVVSFAETSVIHTYQVGEKWHQTQFAYVQIDGQCILNEENDNFVYVEIERIGDYVEHPYILICQEAIEKSLSLKCDLKKRPHLVIDI